MLRTASLSALYIPALNGGVFRAIRDKFPAGWQPFSQPEISLRSIVSTVK
jgi:hypothetical protein